MVAVSRIGRKLTQKQQKRRLIQKAVRQATQSVAVTSPAAPPFYKTATPEEWARALREWSEGFRSLPQAPAMVYSREADYEDRF